MATDIYVGDGLTQQRMAELALKYRHAFKLATRDFVDIVEVLEFKIPQAFPDFRLVVRPDDALESYAITYLKKCRIEVRENVYNSACEGDTFSRFVLAHELAHFLLHQNIGDAAHATSEEYEESIQNLNSLESAEDQADIFARHFLIHPNLAFEHKGDFRYLASITGTPSSEAKTAITISKRLEMLKVRSEPRCTS